MKWYLQSSSLVCMTTMLNKLWVVQKVVIAIDIIFILEA